MKRDELLAIYKKYGVTFELAEKAAQIQTLLNKGSDDVREDNALLTLAFICLSDLQYRKEGSYGRSWSKRGETDVFFNTARKFDRLENMVLYGSHDEVGEGRIDTVGDLANYSLLWMTYFIRETPSEFKKWVETS